MISQEINVGLLTELKMLDLSRLLPGPYCSLLLSVIPSVYGVSDGQN
jgi:crotonobetainyl-CoA:carnitine CoA-transferase CaiB-like acyl-CoA transferase